MLLHDCQIITDDMLLTSSHLHVALYIGSLATAPWCWAYQDPLSPPAHLGVCERGDGVSAHCHGSLGPKVRRRSLVTSSQSCFLSPPLTLCLPLSVRWRSQQEKKKSLGVCVWSSNALCQLAVPTVTVEIHLFCWRPFCVAESCQPQQS